METRWVYYYIVKQSTCIAATGGKSPRRALVKAIIEDARLSSEEKSLFSKLVLSKQARDSGLLHELEIANIYEIERSYRSVQLTWSSRFISWKGKQFLLFLFNPTWGADPPGDLPLTCILTTDKFQLITWRDIAPCFSFDEASIETVDLQETVLKIKCDRTLTGYGRYKCVVTPVEIRQLGGFEVIDGSWAEELWSHVLTTANSEPAAMSSLREDRPSGDRCSPRCAT